MMIAYENHDLGVTEMFDIKFYSKHDLKLSHESNLSFLRSSHKDKLRDGVDDII